MKNLNPGKMKSLNYKFRLVARFVMSYCTNCINRTNCTKIIDTRKSFKILLAFTLFAILWFNYLVPNEVSPSSNLSIKPNALSGENPTIPTAHITHDALYQNIPTTLTAHITHDALSGENSTTSTAPTTHDTITTVLHPSLPTAHASSPTTHNVSAWLPSWDVKEAFNSFKNNKDTIDTISPFWYNVNKDGTLTEKTSPGGKSAVDEHIIEFAHENGVTIIPTITNSFDGEKVSPIFNDPDLKRQNIQNIIDIILAHNYDGIDIDYEGLKSEDKDAFTAYIRDLREELNKYNKKLTIAIQANSFSGLLIYGDRGQDWAQLHHYVDEFRIMTYDYGWRGSIPRPVAPYYWVEEVVLYALANVPAEKIYVGIPFYGYGWSDDYFSSYTYDTIKLILSKYGVDFQYDPWQKTNRLFYVSEFDSRETKVPHEVWFENHVSIEPKLDLVKRFNLGGIAIWRLGKEDKENWRRIKRDLKAGALDLPLYFKDVDRNTEYYNEITRLADLGIVRGQGNSYEFMPYQKVNRAEILKMSLNSFARDISKYAFLELMPEEYENPFSDVYDNEWYFAYVQTAVEMGVIEGYPDGTFKPDKSILRVEAIKLAVESADITTRGVRVNERWYQPYAEWAVNQGIYEAGFTPEEEITRGEAAYILAKVIETVEK